MRFYLAYSGTDQIYYTVCNKLEVKPATLFPGRWRSACESREQREISGSNDKGRDVDLPEK